MGSPASSLPNGGLALRGFFVNPLTATRAECYPDGLLVAKEAGNGCKIEAFGDAASVASECGVDLEGIPASRGILLPPFFDVHFHWVQDDVRMMPKASLLEWLDKYTFPTESKFADPEYAEVKAKFFWKRILDTGTIGGLCYSSVHATALDAAMRHAPEHFRIGSSLMTMHCPEYLMQSVDEAMDAVFRGFDEYGERFVVTPRFAPVTHPEVMRATAKKAAQCNGFIQTHLCETHAEIEWVTGMYRRMEGFEDIASYTEIYDRVDNLGPKTVMGHCIHMTDSEWALLSETDTAIASCPTSNAPIDQLGLGSGLFDYKRADTEGVRWALASDIGGGPYLSMFDVMDSFVHQNVDATWKRALYHSTIAGAEILGLGSRKGSFTPGNDFDYIELDVDASQCIKAPILDVEQVFSSIADAWRNDRSSFEQIVAATVIEGRMPFAKGAAQY